MLKQKKELPPTNGEEKKSLMFEQPNEQKSGKELLSIFGSAPGLNSTQAESANAIAKSSINSNTISDMINVGSLFLKGAGGIIGSLISPTTAYGGQPRNFPDLTWDGDVDKLLKEDKRSKEISGMSKSEIQTYDQLQKIKSTKTLSKPTYLKQG